ncbi:MAG: NADH-quinone oxidoreductase subunit J [Chloroflexota bacterium]
MTPDLLLFFSLAALAVITAVGMLVSRDAVYSTLLLVVNFVVVAVLYLLLQAAFIAMVQVTVYAGAIMVLFLFVVMLLGAEHLPSEKRLRWERPGAIVLGVALLAEALLAIWVGRGVAVPAAPDQAFGSPAAVGGLLFRNYLIPIEVASVLLLAAMVGAIVLSRKERKSAR